MLNGRWISWIDGLLPWGIDWQNVAYNQCLRPIFDTEWKNRHCPKSNWLSFQKKRLKGIKKRQLGKFIVQLPLYI